MKQCDTCIYGNKSEYEKPCIVYKGVNCELYEKRGEDMTRADAIKELSEMRTDAWTDSRQIEALNMAIKSIENIGHLTDRPCEVCEFHGENGCTQWKCVFCDELFGGIRR